MPIPDLIQGYWLSYLHNNKKRAKNDVYYVPGVVRNIIKPPFEFKQFTIPQQKQIMLAPMMSVSIIDKRGFQSARDTMIENVTRIIDAVSDLVVFIDGRLVSTLCVRAMSEFFEVDKNFIVLSDGYWLLLEPYYFSKGIHIVESHALIYNSSMSTELEYELEIV